MAVKNGAKHQHWVPQFYLRQFATPESRLTDEPQVWLLDIPEPDEGGKVTSVRNVCGKRYLYSPEDVNGERDWSVEELLGNVESLAASLWPILNEGSPDLAHPTIRRGLSYYLAFQHLRNLWLYNLIDHAFGLRNKLYGPPTAESLAARDPTWPDPAHSGRFFSQTIIRDVERIVERFAAKHWAVLCTEKDLLLTSDRPLIFARIHDDDQQDVGIFPLSPRRVLVMTDKLDPADPVRWLYAELPEDVAQIINVAISEQCIRFVFAGRPIPDVLGDSELPKKIHLRREERQAERRRAAEDNSRTFQQHNR